ncbi:MAG: glutamate formimidoyltransferase [Planctomycetota bacterium]|nr:MAG: glutamate formimidoyltransferase [Planctomycetota bacterium]
MRVECVPNISEGRRKDVIDAVVAAARAAAPVALVDVSSDADHNRSVITFVGEGQDCVAAAVALCGKAAELIDLNQHQGEHPRMGATDVIPFVPLGDTPMEHCVELARQCGSRIGRELKIPVFYYESAATRPSRRNLADVRKGQFEGLRELIGKDPERTPDAGPRDAIHPTAGAVAVGARFFLIAFNVNLGTADVQVAKDIARRVREKDGGLSGIKAMGFLLEDRDPPLSQVSMNVCNYRATSPLRVYQEIEKLAAERGVAIVESELVGLAPAEALPADAAQRVKLRGFDPEEQILERKVAKISSLRG